MAKFDARALGCHCDQCWLGQQARKQGTYFPVGPEQEDPDAKNIAVAQMPGNEELVRRRPIIGETWKELNRGFATIGLKRTDFRIDNAILCMPSNGNWERMEHEYKKDAQRIKAENQKLREGVKTRKARKLAQVEGSEPTEEAPQVRLHPVPLHPVEACRPHLIQRLEHTPNVLVLGSVPYNSFTGSRKAVKEIRGAFIERWLAQRDDGTRLVARPGGDRDPTTNILPQPIIKHSGNWNVLQELHLVPTFNPFMVRKAPALRVPFEADLRRFVRWRDNKLEWQKPVRVTNPSPATLRRFLAQPKRFFTYDIETDGIDPSSTNMRCISIVALQGPGDQPGTKGAGVVIHFRSIGTGITADGVKYIQKSDPIFLGDEPDATPERSYYTFSDAVEIRQILISFLSDPTILKVGHNSGMFDTQTLTRVLPLHDPLTVYSGHVKDAWEDVLASDEGYTAVREAIAEAATQPPEVVPILSDVPIPSDLQPVRGNHDTILYFRGGYSELTRDLYTLGTISTDVTAWKADADDKKKATDAKSDDVLGEYCLTDSYVDALATPPLALRVRNRRQNYAVALDHGVQQVARGMQQLGLRVNQPARQVIEDEYRERVHRHRSKILDLLGGDTKFNPNSAQQLGNLIYGRLGAPPLAYSEDTGEPSTEDSTLVMLKRTPGALTPLAEAIIDEIRALRNVSKQLGTYILPWRMHNDLRMNSDKKMVGGICGPDGRLHPSYNVARPKTGRISSSGPNAQNVSKFLRKLIIPEDGHCFVGADYDQIELRLVSAVARCMAYLRVFINGGDPHAVTAIQIYGEGFLKELQASLTPEQWLDYKRTGAPVKAGKQKTKAYDSLRTFAKSFVYAVIYGGTPETIYNVVSLAEDDDGKLMFPDMTRGEIKAAYNAWIRNTPEIPAWWGEVERFCNQHGYVEEPFLGRRRDFPKFDRNEALNLPIQGGAAIVMGRGLVRLARRLPFDFDERTGIANQCHDAITAEVLDKPQVVRETKEIIEESLYARYNGVDFSSEASDAVYNWKEAA